MDDVLRIDPRQVAFNRARQELGTLLFDWQGRHDLTAAEVVTLLAEAIMDEGNSSIRAERADSA